MDSAGTFGHTRNPLEAFGFVDGEWCSSGTRSELREPFRGEVATIVHSSDLADLDRALVVAACGRKGVASLAGYERARILRRSSALLVERAERIASALTRETGKTIRDARQELARAAEVMSFCADEAVRIEGRHIPLDGSATGSNKLAVGMRFPIGVVAGIVPFNAPINLACHKIGPALAAGNPIVVKAPPQAPYTLQLLAQVCVDAGFPPGSLALLQGGGDIGEALVRDARVDFISFTGSARAGSIVKSMVGLRGCILELGGLGPTIVHRDADLGRAAQMCAQAGFRLAGQSCASVQNLFVHESVAELFIQQLRERVDALRLGDPADATTDVGPVIDQASADRIVNWISEAAAAAATVLCGGGHKGTLVQPTLITGVSPSMSVVCREIFGPVVVVRPYSDLSEVFAWIRDTGLGLNCGMFTEAHSVALRAIREVPCASIIVNGTSTFRPDQIPYGGLRGSGYGRESPHETIRAMTQERILVFA